MRPLRSRNSSASHRLLHVLAGCVTAVLALSGCTSTSAPATSTPPVTYAIDLGAEVPYSFQVAQEIAGQVYSLAPCDECARSLYEAGVTSARTVVFSPSTAEQSAIVVNLFYMPKTVFDAASNPNEPPLYGEKVASSGDYILSAITAFDMPYESGSLTGEHYGQLVEAAGKASSYTPRADAAAPLTALQARYGYTIWAAGDSDQFRLSSAVPNLATANGTETNVVLTYKLAGTNAPDAEVFEGNPLGSDVGVARKVATILIDGMSVDINAFCDPSVPRCTESDFAQVGGFISLTLKEPASNRETNIVIQTPSEMSGGSRPMSIENLTALARALRPVGSTVAAVSN